MGEEKQQKTEVTTSDIPKPITAEPVAIEDHGVPVIPAHEEPIVGQSKHGFREKIGKILKSKKFWAIFIVVLLLIVAALWFIQPTRLWLVNAIGQRTSVSASVMTPKTDQQESLPIQNVDVQVGSSTAKTDDKGNATVTGVTYGEVTVVAKKNGYAMAQTNMTLDVDPFFGLFGKKQTQPVQLLMEPVGLPVSFKVKDSISGLPITDGEFAAGDLVVKPNEEGLISFKAPSTDSDLSTIKVTSKLGNYINKEFDVKLNSTDAPEEFSFVPAGKHYFVSKRTGVFSVFSSNVDGSDVQEVIPGTGKETNEIAFSVSPDGKYGVLLSSRDGIRDNKKELVQRLYIVDLDSKQLTKVDESNIVRFFDWSGNSLVYQMQPVNQDPAKSQVYSLKTLDVANKRVVDLATDADFFGGVYVGYDKILYTQYNYGSNSANNPVLKATNATATSTKELGQKIYTLVRTNFDTLVFKTEADQKWQEYNFNSGGTKTSAPPSGSMDKIFLGSSNAANTMRLLIDRIDGKNVLVSVEKSNNAEKQLYAAAGLGGPIRWIGDVVVFRIVTPQETADYVVSIKGGTARKITDVSATASTQDSRSQYLWFY